MPSRSPADIASLDDLFACATGGNTPAHRCRTRAALRRRYDKRARKAPCAMGGARQRMPNPGGSAGSRSIEIESRRICDQNFLSHLLVGSEFREQIGEISVVRCVSRRKVVRVGPVGTPDDALG